MKRRSLTQLAVLAALVSGCISAPDVIIVDRQTALEQQANGRFPTLQEELDAAAITSEPVPFTRAGLEEAGWQPRKEHDAIARLYREASRQGERIDQLLRRRCIGEAADGSLAETKEQCRGGVDVATVSALLERANRNRRQIWRHLLGSRPESALPGIRGRWREAHLQSVVCGGHIQRQGGAWVVKEC